MSMVSEIKEHLRRANPVEVAARVDNNPTPPLEDHEVYGDKSRQKELLGNLRDLIQDTMHDIYSGKTDAQRIAKGMNELRAGALWRMAKEIAELLAAPGKTTAIQIPTHELFQAFVVWSETTLTEKKDDSTTETVQG